MTKDIEFFRSLSKNIKASIGGGQPARVVSIYGGRCTVQPLFMDNINGKSVKRGLIENCPIAKHCWQDIKVGSVVFIMASERSMEGYRGTDYIYPSVNRVHSATDSVVLGVL